MSKSFFTHEKLARLFVPALYGAGIALTLLLIVEAQYWGFLSSFGRWRMMGLLFSCGSIGFLLSRLIAGRYGNRLAARLLPCHLYRAVSARRVMQDFGLDSVRDLCAFIQLYHLAVYSARKPFKDDFAVELDCLLEPLFLHNMYLPMMRTWLIRSGRLVFDADALTVGIQKEKERLDMLQTPRQLFNAEFAVDLPDAAHSSDAMETSSDQNKKAIKTAGKSPDTRGTEPSTSILRLIKDDPSLSASEMDSSAHSADMHTRLSTTEHSPASRNSGVSSDISNT